MNHRRTVLFILVTVFALHPRSGLAQEVRWRSDYNAARGEAREYGRPLLVNIGAERCVWCQRLDATTFRDAALAALLNERLIPLKVDGTGVPELVQALRIQAYPTLLLASPDGKIFETVEGYVEAARLTELVQRLLAAVAPPAFSRDVQEAVSALEANDVPTAIERLRRALREEKDPSIQAKARGLMQQIEQRAASRLAQLQALTDQGQAEIALDALAAFTRAFEHTTAGTAGAALAKQLAERPDVKAKQRERRARELILLAREDFREKRYLPCLDRCEALIAQFPSLAECAEAREMAAAIKDHPERLQQLCDALSDRLGDMQLLLAESLLKQGRPAEAAAALEHVVQKLPGTRTADRARLRLTEVQRLFPREAAER